MKDRFKIRGHLGQGTYGQVFAGQDLLNGNPVCIKLNKHKDINKFEYNALKDLNAAGFTNFPHVYGYGQSHN